MTPKITIKGYKEAIAALKGLASEVQQKILISAEKTAMKPTLRSAQSFAPRKSGNLQSKLKVVKLREKRGPKYRAAVGVMPVFKKGGSNQYYARWIQEGTKDPRRARSKKVMVFTGLDGKLVFTKQTQGIKANRFLSKAYEATRTSMVSTFGRDLAASMQRYARRNFKNIK